VQEDAVARREVEVVGGQQAGAVLADPGEVLELVGGERPVGAGEHEVGGGAGVAQHRDQRADGQAAEDHEQADLGRPPARRRHARASRRRSRSTPANATTNTPQSATIATP
jgi:hypothetical protein